MESKEALQAFISLQESIPVIPLNKIVKVRTNGGGEYSFEYADLPSIHKVVKPLANKYGFSLHYQVGENHVSAIITHVSGEDFKSSISFTPGNDPKTTGSLITYYKRYMLSALLALDTEEDKDIQPMDKPKPKLSGQAYEKACERIKDGEKGVLNKCLAHFTLSDTQKDVLLNLEMQHG